MGTSVFCPSVCPLCLRDVCEAGDSLCPSCRAKLVPLPTPRCPRCGGVIDGVVAMCEECLSLPERPWGHAICLYPYRGPVREAIHQLKYSNQPYCARFLGAGLASTWRDHAPDMPDAVVPIPLHWLKQFRRGYNQAELLGRSMARSLGIPVRCVLVRTKRTRQQARLSLELRRQNVQNCFKLKRRAKLAGAHIVVVDDVFTTGATLDAAVRTLLSGGAARVSVAAVARG